jgi:hypothetical protein
MNTKTCAAAALLAIAALGLAPSADARTRATRYSGTRYTSAVVRSGAAIRVRLNEKISTESAHRGQTWTGTVIDPVYTAGGVAIPAGSPVSGIVTTAAQGTHTTRPEIGLAIRRVHVHGRSYALNADTPTIVAGSNRAKKVGAIAVGTAAGALLGHAAGEHHHGTLIGGIVGGATGYGLTRHALRTMELKPGTEITFTAREEVAMRR